MTQRNEEFTLDHDDLRRVLHDLSNTLTGLLMNAGLLAIALRGNERLRHYVDEITAGGERGAALVQEARAMLVDSGDGTGRKGEVTDDCDSDPVERRVLARRGVTGAQRRPQ